MKTNQVAEGMWAIWCPACKDEHYIYTWHKQGYGPRWEYNNRPEAPTFTPSVNVMTSKGQRCHFYITEGFIQFQSDCSHNFKGHTIELEHLKPDV